jgi:signal transduction histidine kinase
MFSTLRSRLWLGYAILIITVVGAFSIGLLVALNNSNLLYRQVILQMRLVEQNLIDKINQQTGSPVEEIKSLLNQKALADNIRVILLDSDKTILFDSKSNVQPAIRWLTLIGIQQTEDLVTTSRIRDTNRKLWLYVGQKLSQTNQYLVIATPRGFLSLKFLLSDPMIRMILRVVLLAIIIAFLLTLLMDRWLAEPIRKISRNASSLISGEHAELPVEGAKEVKELARALNQMGKKVKESQDSQRDFISDVSHELKTPLTSIQGFSNAILDGTATEHNSVKHAAQVISSEADRMLRLVLDLLTLTRLEGGVEVINKQTVDLNSLVETSIEKFSLLAKKSKINLEIKTSPLPTVFCDPDRITQIITNLLDNAIKFTPQGGSVTVRTLSSGSEVIVDIIDIGIGISDEELSKIFNRFYQGDKSRQVGASKSAGLGLPIARQIARTHGGDLTVSSTVGKGTTFTLRLPTSSTTEKTNRGNVK